jgi:hypothetical protein
MQAGFLCSVCPEPKLKIVPKMLCNFVGFVHPVKQMMIKERNNQFIFVAPACINNFVSGRLFYGFRNHGFVVSSVEKNFKSI